MKPIHNRYYCRACGKPKMLFTTKAKADNFMRFNADEFPGKKPVRSYYCTCCDGWHLTSSTNESYFATYLSPVELAFKRHRELALSKAGALLTEIRLQAVAADYDAAASGFHRLIQEAGNIATICAEDGQSILKDAFEALCFCARRMLHQGRSVSKDTVHNFRLIRKSLCKMAGMVGFPCAEYSESITSALDSLVATRQAQPAISAESL